MCVFVYIKYTLTFFFTLPLLLVYSQSNWLETEPVNLAHMNEELYETDPAGQYLNIRFKLSEEESNDANLSIVSSAGQRLIEQNIKFNPDNAIGIQDIL